MEKTNPAKDEGEADRAADEIRAAGKLASDGLRGLTGIIRDTHAAIAKSVEEQLPPSAKPSAAAEREISAAVYSILDAAHEAVARAATEAAVTALPPDAAPPSATPAGASAQAAVNALWGDALQAQGSSIAQRMTVRAAGTELGIDRDSLAAGLPSTTGDIVLFVHGLGEDERAWHLPFQGDAESYAERLTREHGMTCLAVRYNTGLHISENGKRLGELLDGLTEAWSVPVVSVSLVGHSMGGLVSRSAVHLAAERGAAWVPSLRTVVTLGSPHLGAPLEQGANLVDVLLRQRPETVPLSRILAIRSAGVKDLRYGSLVSEDWDGHDPDEFLTNRCAQVPLLDQVAYYWVAATITATPDHPIGQLLGDGLVRLPSAAGQDEHHRIGFPIESGVRLTSMNHLRLLNHPSIYEYLAAWLALPDGSGLSGPAVHQQ